MQNLKLQIKNAPKTPGVYFFKNAQGKILYIGKAANLKNRLNSYLPRQAGFRLGSGGNYDLKKEELILRSKKIDWRETDSEIEALILEAKLIKEFKPLFNVSLRDDKNYSFVVFTKEDFPRVFITHQPKIQNIRLTDGQTKYPSDGRAGKIRDYIGPFTEAKPLRFILNTLRRIFPFRTCKNKFEKPCFHYHIGLCPAHPPAQAGGKASEEKDVLQTCLRRQVYKNDLRNLALILKADKKQILKNFKKQLKTEIKKEEFENAAKTQDKIQALEKIFRHRKVINDFKKEFGALETKTINDLKSFLNKIFLKNFIFKNQFRIEGYDVAHLQGKAGSGAMVVFENLPRQADIKAKKSDYRIFKLKSAKPGDDPAGIAEILGRRFKHQEWAMPDLILIDGGKPQLSAALKIITNSIAVLALAKKEEELYFQRNKKLIKIASVPAPFINLFIQIRDEVHRFANSYHKKLRKKEFFN